MIWISTQIQVIWIIFDCDSRRKAVSLLSGPPHSQSRTYGTLGLLRSTTDRNPGNRKLGQRVTTWRRLVHWNNEPAGKYDSQTLPRTRKEQVCTMVYGNDNGTSSGERVGRKPFRNGADLLRPRVRPWQFRIESFISQSRKVRKCKRSSVTLWSTLFDKWDIGKSERAILLVWPYPSTRHRNPIACPQNPIVYGLSNVTKCQYPFLKEKPNRMFRILLGSCRDSIRCSQQLALAPSSFSHNFPTVQVRYICACPVEIICCLLVCPPNITSSVLLFYWYSLIESLQQNKNKRRIAV